MSRYLNLSSVYQASSEGQYMDICGHFCGVCVCVCVGGWVGVLCVCLCVCVCVYCVCRV